MLYLGGIESNLRILQDLEKVEHHETALFPLDVDETVTLTALDTANTFSDYVEIADDQAVTLSSKFATYRGHICSMVVEEVSEIDTVYEVEISYGASHIVITRWRFAGETKFTHPVHQLRVRASDIPAGETVYYRMRTATAVADTALVQFRYFLHD